MPPTIYDKEGWKTVLLEHRRRLFERVVAAFPAEVKKQRTTVDIWRIRLSGPPHNGPAA